MDHTLEDLWRRLGTDDWTADDETAWHNARNAAIQRIREYIAPYLRAEVGAEIYAIEIMNRAEEMGRISGNDVSGEIGARYAKSGNPLAFTV